MSQISSQEAGDLNRPGFAVHSPHAREIAAGAMQNAVCLMSWYVAEAARLRDTPRADPRLQRAALLLGCPAVKAGMALRSQRAEVEAEAVLRRLRQMANFDIRKLFNDDGSMKAITELDDETALGVTSIELVELKDRDGNVTGYSKEARLVDLRAVLVDVGRHLGMFDAKLRISEDKENPIALLIKQVQGNALPVVADPVDDEDDGDVAA